MSDLLPAFQPALWLWQESVPQHSSLLDLLLRASPIAKFVLFVLLIFSIASWAIIFTKAPVTKLAQQQASQFLQLFANSSHWADLHSGSANLRENPLAAIFFAADAEMQKQGTLNIEAVHRAMQSTAVDETTRLEKSLGWLASTASAAPFIGLFGTVVGIIIAFQGLSQATTASIQAVAPGIAEALIATAAGIAAAVPAVLGYNHYVNQIKTMAAEMDSFTLRLLNFIEREVGQ